VIDETRLREVTGGDAVFALELIELLVSEATQLADELRARHKLGDRARLKEGGHALKGMAANVGATRLAALGERLQSEAANPSAKLEDLGDLLMQIDAQIAAIQAWRAQKSREGHQS